MKKTIASLLLISYAFAGTKTDVLRSKLIEAGRPYDLSKTLLAIAKVESNNGQVKINLQDPSCGVMMIHIKFYLHRNKIKDTNFNRNYHCQKLISNDDLAISEAVALLTFWKDKFCNKYGCTKEQWLKVWSAYNSGYNWNSKAGATYALRIQNQIEKEKLKN